MANATTPVTKVDYGRQASRSLVNAILEAARNNDPGRVAELTSLFREFVRDGFAPMLKEARESVPPKSPAAEQLADIQTQANKDLTELKGQLSAGEVGASQQVQAAVKQLDELTEQLK